MYAFSSTAILALSVSISTAIAIPAPQSPKSPSSQQWRLISDAAFYGQSLDAINGSIYIGTKTPDPSTAAVMLFNGPDVTGPFTGQTYFIDNRAALRYTQHGEVPDGTSTGAITNSVMPSGRQGQLLENLAPGLGWTACPSTNGKMQVFMNKPGVVGQGAKTGDCTPLIIVTVLS